MHRRRVFGVLSALGLVAACAGGGSGPVRPVVSMADEVGTVDRRLIVGTWQCRELNPYPGRPAQTTMATYNADGTFTSEGRAAGQGPVGAMVVNARVNWAVQGEQMVSSNVRSEARAADGNAATNMLAGLGAAIANSMMASQREGAADLLKLSRGEMVLRPVGVEDAPVLSCTR